MADQNRIGGIIQVVKNGVLLDAKGNFSYNLGNPKREAVMGAGAIPGYKESPQVAFIEGEITDNQGNDLDDLTSGTGLTITLNLANGKTISLGDAWFAGEGTASTEEGTIAVRWESRKKAKELLP